MITAKEARDLVILHSEAAAVELVIRENARRGITSVCIPLIDMMALELIDKGFKVQPDPTKNGQFRISW